jgi:glycosyltransferase involved in cell wall biosynthesis
VLLEAGRPILGGLAGRDFATDADLLRRSGIEVGLVFHGSEVRDPRRHRRTHEFSPFADRSSELTRTLQARCDALLPLLDRFDGPLLASTPDQLDYLPERARWLPVVIDTQAFRPDGPGMTAPLERRRPLVVHMPSNPALKGSEDVERILAPMAARGLIELRMVTGLPPEEAAEVIRSADVVVDQLLLGLYGVLACEAMASGRVVLGHLGDSLRARVGRPVPVIEATPATLGGVMQRLLDEPDWGREAAQAGPGFVNRVHDGRRSAAVLAGFLGVPAPAPGPGQG